MQHLLYGVVTSFILGGARLPADVCQQSRRPLLLPSLTDVNGWCSCTATDSLNLKGPCVVWGKNFNIYNINAEITQTQKYSIFPYVNIQAVLRGK